MSSERVYRIDVSASPDEAWAALTEPAGTRAWYFGTWPRTTWEVGSVIDYVDDDGDVQITGTVLTCEPPRTLAHTFIAVWGAQPDDQGTLRWTIEENGEGSTITLVHSGGHGAETAEGSREIIDALKAYLES